MLAVTADAAWRIVTPLIAFEIMPNGTGDTVAALFTAHWLESGDIAAALGGPRPRSMPCSRRPGRWASANCSSSPRRTGCVSPPRRFTRREAIATRCTFPASPTTRSCSRRGRGDRLPDRRAGRTGGGAVHPPLDHRRRRRGLPDRPRRRAGRRGVRRGRRLRPAASSRSSSRATKPGCAASAGWCWSVMGWSTMRHRLRTVGDPVSDDREHRSRRISTSPRSSFFITVFNPLTVMAFGAAFAGRDLAGVGASLPDAATLVAGVFARRLAWWAIVCTASVALRQHFTGKGILWLNRITGAVILAFGVVALISLLPLPAPHRPRARSLGTVSDRFRRFSQSPRFRVSPTEATPRDDAATASAPAPTGCCPAAPRGWPVIPHVPLTSRNRRTSA